MEIAFWILAGLVFYTYLGYGILIYVLVRLKGTAGKYRVPEPQVWPEVTLVIPAYNEESYIKAKAENSLALEYPEGLLRILFITDGSTDNTRKILKTVEGVEVIHENIRGGKSAAENRAMKFVKSPIVVFCDANTELNPDAIKNLVRHYSDPMIGAVSGEKKVISMEADNASGAGEGIYWKYESFLKKMDSRFYTVVGAAGELVSFRSELVEDLEPDTILDDFVQSLRICKKGYRVLYEPEAFAIERASANVKEELKRKIRIAAGGWQAMSRLLPLLNPFRNFKLTFQYISHRVLRWSLSAFALPLILIINLFLALERPDSVYFYIFILQLLFYLMGTAGWILSNNNIKFKPLFVPYYFIMMNYAVLAGFIRWTRKRQQATWEKARRAEAQAGL